MKKNATQITSMYLDFKPYLQVKTEIDGDTTLKYIDLNLAVTLPQISEMIREHYHINLGRCIFCGNITGYTFYKSINTAIEFDINGNVVSEKNIPPENRRNVTAFGGLFALLTC